jgi:hypothetical protein
MLLFTGTITKDGARKVLSFEAVPCVENMIALVEEAEWGSQASDTKVNELGRAILQRITIPAVVERLLDKFIAQVIRPMDSTRPFYLSGDELRLWIDVQLLGIHDPSNPYGKACTGTVQ